MYGDAHDVKGKGRADGRSTSSRAAAAQEAVQREAELRAMFVVVPPGDEAKAISCPICKEPLKSEFLEDDEDELELGEPSERSPRPWMKAERRKAV